MGITHKVPTKNKAALKLYNTISSYIFEQEYDELKNYPKVKEVLLNAKKELYTLLK